MLARVRPPACAAHRLRNLLAKLPERERERVRLAYWQALDDATGERDEGSVWGRSSTRSTVPATPPPPDASPTTSTARRSSALPDKTPPRVALDQPVERSLAEIKRRTKVIGRFPGEISCLTLVGRPDLYITHAKNGVRFTQLEHQRLRRIRQAGSEPTSDEEVSAA